jgi:hypothetical protein
MFRPIGLVRTDCKTEYWFITWDIIQGYISTVSCFLANSKATVIFVLASLAGWPPAVCRVRWGQYGGQTGSRTDTAPDSEQLEVLFIFPNVVQLLEKNSENDFFFNLSKRLDHEMDWIWILTYIGINKGRAEVGKKIFFKSQIKKSANSWAHSAIANPNIG